MLPSEIIQTVPQIPLHCRDGTCLPWKGLARCSRESRLRFAPELTRGLPLWNHPKTVGLNSVASAKHEALAK